MQYAGERPFLDQAAATSTASGLNKERFLRIVSSTMSPHWTQRKPSRRLAWCRTTAHCRRARTTASYPSPATICPTVVTSGPAASGKVLLSSRSRLVLEPGEAGVAVYYILDIVNNSGGPVTASPEFAFDMPAGAVGTSLLEGSTPLATVTGNHVQVEGPFAPGQTLVQVAAAQQLLGGALLQLQ
jgi:hypothetical protein